MTFYILDTITVQVVEEPYTMRRARIHLIHVRDLLKFVDPTDAYNGSDCASVSFLNTVCQGDIMEKKRTRPEAVDCMPPDFILPRNSWKWIEVKSYNYSTLYFFRYRGVAGSLI